jgi:acyl-coenzyme A synthetase/AMP-(fatty) acid ligase
MTVTIERLLAGSRGTRLVVGDVSWTSADLLRCGGRLGAEIARRRAAPAMLAVSTTNAALLTAVLAAAGQLRVPVLLLDPESTATSFGSVDDVLVSDRPVPGGGSTVEIDGNLACHLLERANGGSGALPADALLFQTSGSTAAPRAVVKSFAAVLNDSVRIADHLHGGATAPDVVCAAPVFHSYGFTHGLLAGLLVGATTVYRTPSSSPSSLAKAVTRAGAGTLIALPTQLQMIAAARSLDFGGLANAVSAGAPIRPDAVARICRDFSFRLLNAYGASELGTCAIGTLSETSPPGCVGEPLRGVELRVDGGELVVRNDAFALGYLADGQVRPLPTEDGWYRTGDLAERGPDGVRITGRRGDVINIAGRKTRRSRLEAVLSEHPDVLEVQVLAVDDEYRGEVPVARVVVKPGRARPDILAWSRERLDAFEVPRQVEWLDRLPRSATGKLMYASGAKG